jgi:hypothetical protein
MSVLSYTIPVPAADLGPSVDVSALVGPKTVQLSGLFAGRYNLLASHDDVHFDPVLSFNAGGEAGIEQVLEGTYRSFRLESRAAAQGTVTCHVSGVDGAGENFFLTVASVGAGFSGLSPVVDTSAAIPPTGPEDATCFLARGAFRGTLVVLGSVDGVEFNPVGSWQVDRLPEGSPTDLELAPLSTFDETRYVRVQLIGVAMGPLVVTVGSRVIQYGSSVDSVARTAAANAQASANAAQASANAAQASANSAQSNLTSHENLTMTAHGGVVPRVDTIALLRTYPTLSGEVLVAGYSSASDGGGGPFAWSSTSAAADDGGLVILPTGHVGPGRWLRQYGGAPSVAYWGALGVGDDTVAIQQAINTCPLGNLQFQPTTYTTSANLNLKSGVNLVGNGAAITYASSWANLGAFLSGSGVAGVAITNLTLDGKGTWTSTPFPNPYGGGNSVGFTNNHVGISLASCSNVKLRDCNLEGVGIGLFSQSCLNLKILGCELATLGSAGLNFSNSQTAIVDHCKITSVLGNITVAGDVNVNDSKFADGIFVYCSKWLSIGNNVIDDVVRIGVVLEGDSVTLNSGITISSNVLRNFNNARGGETNAAIWDETNRSDRSCVATGNTCNNTGAAGAGGANGICSSQLQVVGNNIVGFQGLGIRARDCTIQSNFIEACGQGIEVVFQVAGLTTQIVGNQIQRCLGNGIDVYQSHGIINIVSNYIVDNGQSGLNNAGIVINRYYFDQKVVISGNTFVSSTNQSPGTNGQVYSILGVAGGDFTRSTEYITGNTFLFTGTWTSAYPANLVVAPCSFCYYDTTTFYLNDIGSMQYNTNSKIPEPGAAVRGADWPYLLGYASAAPASGSYRKGDLILNFSPASGQPYGWECTTAGSPGVWKIISTLS